MNARIAWSKVLAAAIIVSLLAACAEKPSGGSALKLSKDNEDYVKKTLGGMPEPVQLVLFSRDGGECKYCTETESLLGEVASLEPQVSLEVLSLKKDAARAAELGIDKVPGIAILGAEDFGLRYFGLPSGMDFIPFVETIRAVSDDEPGLAPETIEGLAKLTKPVQLTVFVTLA